MRGVLARTWSEAEEARAPTHAARIQPRAPLKSRSSERRSPFARSTRGTHRITIHRCNGTICCRVNCFQLLFAHAGRRPVGFDDFRSNGLLLPATEAAAHRTGMPLHRGPHRRYNELVMERVGRIEARWIEASKSDPQAARTEALMRLRLLQIALRRRLLDERKRMILNRKD